MASKKAPEINASSMADIAFLLLVFFLVTTTVDADKGISVKLPVWSDVPPPTLKKNPRNVLIVLVNKNNELLVNKERLDINLLRERCKEFIINPSRRDDMAEAPNMAVVSLMNDRGTSYSMYLQVYNELMGAYNELRRDRSMALYGLPYDEKLLTKEQITKVRSEIPLVISEAESNFAGN